MSTLHELRETRAGKIAEMGALVTSAEGAGRDLTEAEAKRFGDLKAEVRGVEDRIGRAETLADMERRAEGEPVRGADLQHEIRNYSLAAAIAGALSGRLTGREAEIHAELSKGRQTRAGAGIHLAVPTEILLGERRDGQTVGSGPAGGFLVPTSIAAPADRFRPALMVESMGATVLRNLVGDVELPNLANSGTVSWVGENQDATRSAATFEKALLSAHTASGEYRMSRRLMLQSGTAMEPILRRDLGFLLAQALDGAAINGAGAANQPLGILKTTGVEKVTTETAFADTTANLIGALELDDVSGTGAFLTSPTVMTATRKIKDSQGHVIPGAELFHGKRVETTTQAPTDIGNSANKSALIYGLWSELVVGYWSAVDILVNPYHPDVASSGGALLHAFLDADVVVRHVEAFAYAEI